MDLQEFVDRSWESDKLITIWKLSIMIPSGR